MASICTELHLTESSLLMFQSLDGGPVLRSLCSASLLPPEKESKELPGSPLVTSWPPHKPLLCQLCLIMMLSNQPSCRVTIFLCRKTKQDSFLGNRPGHCRWISKQKCVTFSCSCLQLRRKPTRNNLVKLQQLQPHYENFFNPNQWSPLNEEKS